MDDAVSGDGETDETAPARPVLRIVRGDPTPEEVAALTAVLAAASGGGGEPEETGPTSVWNERESLVRRPLTPGPGAWRASALPR
ncbi:acyl-CoA carboxylase subunit epsilon [Actinomycetospora endophytica]|uniref:Acyl-CoA carboxylase subunit epsilon n=1 Tax=Actinomycetospora endophytica TaxID=2291215 RepID=A0ABS8PGN7_9PSEU|nr:acyl-CoA carboxylase subunit epsilon [Actinomycetospora endophytica]MCD2197412.1 acyl-CoA carboxylase subunit epsilon [Actinomycetospora endophytica]